MESLGSEIRRRHKDPPELKQLLKEIRQGKPYYALTQRQQELLDHAARIYDEMSDRGKKQLPYNWMDTLKKRLSKYRRPY